MRPAQVVSGPLAKVVANDVDWKRANLLAHQVAASRLVELFFLKEIQLIGRETKFSEPGLRRTALEINAQCLLHFAS